MKLTQFADETSLILNGTKDSLLAALNTLEIFGDLSGLKVNTDKTKLIWIGKKRYSRDKFDTNRNLLWGNTQFRFLGIEFSVDLSEMIGLNYTAAICQTKQTLNAWKSRYLTPIGKIAVLKALIIPKFNHLFLSLPNPELEQLTQLNHIMYKFIWNDKPDKVKRSQICKSYNAGGLKMIDLEPFIKTLKITWILRLYLDSNAPWVHITLSNLGQKEKILFLGSQWSQKVAGKMKNLFWKDVILAWSSILKKIPESEVLHGPLWYNSKISTLPLFEAELYKKGIMSPIDVLTNIGKIMPKRNIELSYNVSLNFLSYYRLKHCLTRYLKGISLDDNHL